MATYETVNKVKPLIEQNLAGFSEGKMRFNALEKANTQPAKAGLQTTSPCMESRL